MAECAKEDASENDFVMTGLDEAAALGNGIGDRFADEGGAERGDDAVGTVGVATVLNLEDGTLVFGLAMGEKGERDFRF